MVLRRYEPSEYGNAFEDRFMDVVMKQMEEIDEINQKALAVRAFMVEDANRKWHRIKSRNQGRQRQRILLSDAVALVAALGHDVPAFFLLVAQAAKEKLDRDKANQKTQVSEYVQAGLGGCGKDDGALH